MVTLVAALLSILVHTVFSPQIANCDAGGGAVVDFGSYFAHRLPSCCLLCLYFFRKLPMAKLLAALLVFFGSYFSRRLPMAKLLAALLAVLIRGEGGDGNNNIASVEAVGAAVYLVHILPVDWLWRSWWRRCCRPSCLV
jgi:hypothetical protein